VQYASKGGNKPQHDNKYDNKYEEDRPLYKIIVAFDFIPP